MRILVTGGRKYGLTERERNLILRVMNETFPHDPPDETGNYMHTGFLIVGGALGVDSVALDWAVVNWVPWQVYQPTKEEIDLYGPRRAFTRRNQQMLDEGKPDLVLAFQGGGGTADMVARARDAKIPVKFAPAS